jgi:hypothetical protein
MPAGPERRGDLVRVVVSRDQVVDLGLGDGVDPLDEIVHAVGDLVGRPVWLSGSCVTRPLLMRV